MKIKYKKTTWIVNLIAALVWLFYFGIIVFEKEEPNWINYGWIVISLIYFGLYFYQVKYDYITIENDTIRVHGPLGKKLKLKDIKRIRKFAGDYILKSDQTEITINTKIIDSDALHKLNTELEKLNMYWI